MTQLTDDWANYDTEYNGWANYETWNIALWIGNGEGLNDVARGCAEARRPYSLFLEAVRDFGGELALQTPDGVAWNDSGIDKDALDEMIAEL